MTDQQQADKKEEKKRGGLLWMIIALLFGSNVVTIWLYLQEKNKAAEQIIVTEKVVVERDNIKNDLLARQHEYDNLKTNDAALQRRLMRRKPILSSY